MLKVLLLLVLLFSVPSFAQEGGLSGEDGGHGVLCREFGSIDRFVLELLDLYEHRKLNHISNKVVPAQINDQGWRQIPASARDILVERKNAYLKNSKHDVATLAAFDHALALVHSVKLVDYINDTKDYARPLVKIPVNCEIIQLATYSKSKHGEFVLLDREAAAFISANDLAALLLHEAFHAYIRDENTISIRKRVGEIFY
jgi:hypothetical protein